MSSWTLAGKIGRLVILATLMTVCLTIQGNAQVQKERESKVRGDREVMQKDDLWIYNDLEAGLAEATRSHKPLMIVFRCIPCEACSRFDKTLLSRPAAVQDLLQKFVCVRIVQGNHLDLSLFQFDYDQSYHTMFLNADKTIYGRYGTRSRRPEEEDMTITGLREAMLRVLDLHQNYPANKEQLAAKTGEKHEFAVPENMPDLKGKYGALLNYEGDVVKSCVHCHQIRDAERDVYRRRNQPLPEHVLYPYPLPETVGMRMNPDFCGKIASIEPGSAAALAGLKAGDEIVQAAGQPIISTADIQWVLHRSQAPAEIPLVIRRGEKEGNLNLKLADDWKRNSDISWRVTTWPLRGIAAGGLVMESLSEEEREGLNIPADKLALRVKRVGQYGIHAAARNAGFRQGDVFVNVDGSDAPLDETKFLVQMLTHSAGEKIDVTLLRNGKRMELKLPIQ